MHNLDIMRKCLLEESEALVMLANSLDQSSIEFGEELARCKGKLFFTGVGKSFIVASKIAGTFSSIGVSSIPLNPLSILHGDLGVIEKDDILIALSNSGETDILLQVIQFVQSKGAKTVSITGNKESELAKITDKTIEIKTVESGPFGLVPSTSTTAMMAYGDALACLLVSLKGLVIEDFYRNHPEGELGKH